MTILKHRAKQKLYDIASTYQRHISLGETPTLSYSLTCFSRNNNDDPMMPFNLTIDSSITTCVIRECNTGAQSRINTLANCNHDEHDKIWNWIEQRLQIWRKIEFSPSPFRVASETVPADAALEGHIGSAVWLATLKGLDRYSIFLQICNLYTIQFHISSCSSWLQFARVLIPFWAPVTPSYAVCWKSVSENCIFTK